MQMMRDPRMSKRERFQGKTNPQALGERVCPSDTLGESSELGRG